MLVVMNHHVMRYLPPTTDLFGGLLSLLSFPVLLLSFPVLLLSFPMLPGPFQVGRGLSPVHPGPFLFQLQELPFLVLVVLAGLDDQVPVGTPWLGAALASCCKDTRENIVIIWLLHSDAHIHNQLFPISPISFRTCPTIYQYVS
jgi:hypothetical protein